MFIIIHKNELKVLKDEYELLEYAQNLMQEKTEALVSDLIYCFQRAGAKPPFRYVQKDSENFDIFDANDNYFRNTEVATTLTEFKKGDTVWFVQSPEPVKDEYSGCNICRGKYEVTKEDGYYSMTKRCTNCKYSYSVKSGKITETIMNGELEASCYVDHKLKLCKDLYKSEQEAIEKLKSIKKKK